MNQKLKEACMNAGEDVYVAGAHSSPVEEIAEVNARFDKEIAEQEEVNSVRRNIYNDMNTCHDIPKTIIRTVLGTYFDELYEELGNVPELDAKILEECKTLYNKYLNSEV